LVHPLPRYFGGVLRQRERIIARKFIHFARMRQRIDSEHYSCRSGKIRPRYGATTTIARATLKRDSVEVTRCTGDQDNFR
jgi:hypothetical protein